MINGVAREALAWASKAVHAEAQIIAAKQLKGGMSSLVHELRVRVGETELSVVLRLFHDKEWLRNEPDLARHEAESLRMAARSAGVPVPEVIAFDESGADCGMPAVLMSRLDGETVLAPPDFGRWIDGMAEALAALHALEAGEFPWKHFRYADALRLDASAWSRVPGEWLAAAGIVLGPPPAVAPRFIHRDYHPTNILWSGGKVSGIVDWVNGCIGPSGIDVGHCRVNLAQLYGVGAAELFLDAYCRHAGETFTYDPYWDLVSLIDMAYWEPDVYGGWTDLGFTGLDKSTIVARLDGLLLHVLGQYRDC